MKTYQRGNIMKLTQSEINSFKRARTNLSKINIQQKLWSKYSYHYSQTSFEEALGIERKYSYYYEDFPGHTNAIPGEKCREEDVINECFKKALNEEYHAFSSFYYSEGKRRLKTLQELQEFVKGTNYPIVAEMAYMSSEPTKRYQGYGFKVIRNINGLSYLLIRQKTGEWDIEWATPKEIVVHDQWHGDASSWAWIELALE